MSPNKKIILKKSELIDLISEITTTTTVITEQKLHTTNANLTKKEKNIHLEWLSKILNDRNYKSTEEEIEIAQKAMSAPLGIDLGDNDDFPDLGGDFRYVGRYYISLYELEQIHNYYDSQGQLGPMGVNAQICVSAFGACDPETGVTELMIHKYRNRGGVDLFANLTWQLLEYTADAIGIVALFFGPVGWIVSAAMGGVSAWASFEQGHTGTAALTLGLEIIPGAKLFKHFKHVKKLKGLSNETIDNGLKHFKNPTEKAYKLLSKAEKTVVDYTMKNKHTVRALLKNSKEGLDAREILKNIKTLTEFNKIAKTKKGIKLGVDKMSYVEFKNMLKAMSKYQKQIFNIEKGIKAAVPYALVLPVAAYGFSKLADYLNKYFLKLSISKTRDWITSSLEGEIYHYRMDRVLEQKYPYKYYACRKNKVTNEPDCERSLTNTYKDMLDGNPLLLLQLWYDDTTYPELKSLSKTADKGEIQGGWAPESCVGVDLNRSPNPGGGWRPNLNCIPSFELGDVSAEQERALQGFMAIADDPSITGSELNTKIKEFIPNLPESDNLIISKSIGEYREDPQFGLD